MRGAGSRRFGSRRLVSRRLAALAIAGLAALASCESPAREPLAPRPPPPPPGEEVRVLKRAIDAPGEARRPPPATREPEVAPARPPAPAATGMVEILPGVRLDRGARVVEFDGTVPIDCHDPATPRVYLEVVVCTPDTKEHEALVVTRARPSDVHAALLAAGLEPGEPGTWSWEEKKLVSHPPRGAPVQVLLSWRSPQGAVFVSPATDWVVNADSGATFGGTPGYGGWVFAGSRMVFRQGVQRYDADGTGTVVGLCTFGTETVAWKRVISPDSEVQEPEWIADAKRVPARGTAVTVRLRPASNN